jgi:DNA-binding transcriptional MocR family regulator
MRLCFALPSVEDIEAGIAKLARVSFDRTGIPKHGGNVRR